LRLEAENAVLRHQLIVLRPHGRVRLTNLDRWFFVQLYRWFPAILKVLTIIRPETLVRLGALGVLVMLLAPKGLWGIVSEPYGLTLFPTRRRLVVDAKDDDRT
jgi:hypothetical protein